MIDKSECIHIGTLTKSHGITGEAAIILKQGFFSDQIEARFLFLDLDDGLVPFEVENIRDKNDDVILVRFDLCKDEKMVQPLIGSSVWISQNELTKSEEELGVGMLVGYKAIDEKHGEIGTIIDLLDMERNPLFVIEGKNGEVLVPIVDEFILEINDENKKVHLRTPEGLLDLYL